MVIIIFNYQDDFGGEMVKKQPTSLKEILVRELLQLKIVEDHYGILLMLLKHQLQFNLIIINCLMITIKMPIKDLDIVVN